MGGNGGDGGSFRAFSAGDIVVGLGAKIVVDGGRGGQGGDGGSVGCENEMTASHVLAGLGGAGGTGGSAGAIQLRHSGALSTNWITVGQGVSLSGVGGDGHRGGHAGHGSTSFEVAGRPGSPGLLSGSSGSGGNVIILGSRVAVPAGMFITVSGGSAGSGGNGASVSEQSPAVYIDNDVHHCSPGKTYSYKSGFNATSAHPAGTTHTAGWSMIRSTASGPMSIVGLVAKTDGMDGAGGGIGGDAGGTTYAAGHGASGSGGGYPGSITIRANGALELLYSDLSARGGNGGGGGAGGNASSAGHGGDGGSGASGGSVSLAYVGTLTLTGTCIGTQFGFGAPAGAGGAPNGSSGVDGTDGLLGTLMIGTTEIPWIYGCFD